MSLKKIIKLLYKLFISKIFICIYGKVQIQYEEIKDIKTEKIIIDKNHYKLIKIKDGSIFTDYVENVAFLKNNQIIDHFSYQQVKGNLKDSSFNSVLLRGRTRLKKKFNGSIFSLIQGASGNNNYFHWMFDILPKLIILEKIIDVKEIDYFYSPEIKKWQLDTLSIFDINKDRLINSNKYRHIEANEIIGSSHPWYSKGYILEEVNKIPDWIFHEINNRYLKFKQNFSCNSNFYIDRRETTNTHCQIINDDEVKDYLIKKGFSIYKVGTLNFFEQIYLFNNAKIIIGAHGAAFANLVFCNKDTKVIDIIPENHPNLVDASIGKYKKLNFNYIKTKKLHDKSLNGDIWLDINDLNKLI
tara:strand:- start:1211 stop:2281 length:1071 start_codon:yes stop_codon:yes gene_type:complete